jgi:hypothetical protein
MFAAHLCDDEEEEDGYDVSESFYDRLRSSQPTPDATPRKESSQKGEALAVDEFAASMKAYEMEEREKKRQCPMPTFGDVRRVVTTGRLMPPPLFDRKSLEEARDSIRLLKEARRSLDEQIREQEEALHRRLERKV